MNPSIEKITKHILSKPSISEDDRCILLGELNHLQKKLNEDNFMISRLIKDKSIVFNILEATISDLEKSKINIQEYNQKLYIQKEKLKEQKKIIKLKSKKLSENLKKLEHSYNELEEFSHIASHDLKSPLRSISGFARLLQKKYGGQIDLEADQFLSFIVSSANHMHEIIESLLEYSKIAPQQEHFEKINLNDVVQIVENNLSKDIEESKAKIIHDTLPNIKGDKVSFIQLFQNLVGNALKFRSNEPPFIEIKCESIDSFLKFNIIDNGIGLDESFQDKAFLPFQQYEGNSKLGMGIGLAICKKVIKLHDGKIYYYKNPKKGTTFSFEIPKMEMNNVL